MSERHEPPGELDGLVARGELVEPSGRDRAGAEAGAEQRARDGRVGVGVAPEVDRPYQPLFERARGSQGGRGDAERRADIPRGVAVSGCRGLAAKDRPFGLERVRRGQLGRVGSMEQRGDHVAHPGAGVGGMIVEVGELESVRAARARRSASWRWRSAIGAIRIRLPLPALRPARR